MSLYLMEQNKSTSSTAQRTEIPAVIEMYEKAASSSESFENKKIEASPRKFLNQKFAFSRLRRNK